MALGGTDRFGSSRAASWRPQKTKYPGGPCFFSSCVKILRFVFRFCKKTWRSGARTDLAPPGPRLGGPRKLSTRAVRAFFQVVSNFCVLFFVFVKQTWRSGARTILPSPGPRLGGPKKLCIRAGRNLRAAKSFTSGRSVDLGGSVLAARIRRAVVNSIF